MYYTTSAYELCVYGKYTCKIGVAYGCGRLKMVDESAQARPRKTLKNFPRTFGRPYPLAGVAISADSRRPDLRKSGFFASRARRLHRLASRPRLMPKERYLQPASSLKKKWGKNQRKRKEQVAVLVSTSTSIVAVS